MSFFHRLPGAKAAAARYRPVAALLLGATFLFLGQGVFLILVPLKLAADGLTAIEISAVGAAYFAGVVSGAWFGDRITRAVGNIRAYAGSVALIICAALALSLVGSAAGWAALRFMHGWAAAGVFLAIESWLHGATPNEWRGRVVGAYTALTLVGLGGGQLLINVYGPAAPSSVDLGALLFAFSIVPVVLSKASAPAQRTMAPRSPLAIYRHSPLAVAGCVCAGLSMGAFWALGPVFADETASRAASPFMAAAIMGGLSLVWPFGRLSDRIDRRLVIAGLSAGGGAAALLVVIKGATFGIGLLAPVFFYGGVIFSLYPLSVSHAADHLPPEEDMLQVTRGLLLANGFGMALGPLMAGAGMKLLGRDGFFYFPIAVLACLCALALWRVLSHPPAPAEARKSFVHLPETTPASLSMDPRLAGTQLEFDLTPEKDAMAVSQ